MKLILAALAFVLSSANSFADDVVIKSCSVSMPILTDGKFANVKMEVLSKADGGVYSRVQYDMDGKQLIREETAEVSEETVREGLTVEMFEEELNRAERLIVHAMGMAQESDLAALFSPGFDLKPVRSARIFVVGETTNMGSTTIVEAKDRDGKVLGSFLGGFLVSPCL